MKHYLLNGQSKALEEGDVKTSIMKKILIPFFLCSLWSVSAQQAPMSSVEELALVSERVLSENIDNKAFIRFLGISDEVLSLDNQTVYHYLDQQQTNGSWNDVDYADEGNLWNPLGHLDRVVVMSYHYAHNRDPKLKEGINEAMSFWFKRKPKCYNWYKMRITVPRYLGVISLLMREDMDKQVLDRMLNYIASKQEYHSTDRIRSAQSVLYKAIVLQDYDLLQVVSKAILSTLVQSETTNGIQHDWSFRYHDGHFYTASYGKELITCFFDMHQYFEGTSLEMNQHHVEMIDQYVSKGCSPIIYRDQFDYSANGRHMAFQAKWSLDAFIPIYEYLIRKNPEDKKHYKDMVRSLKTNKKQRHMTGNYHYWRGDFMVQRSDDFYTSVRVCSDKSKNSMEMINGENMLGEWSAFGINYIFVDGDEYDYIHPVWDWTSLPGVTCPEVVKRGKSWFSQKTSFVGGASDGQFGAMTMVMDYNDTYAKKSWFFFENEFVALGTAISSDSKHPVNTTINQCLLQSEVYVDGEKIYDDAQITEPFELVWHDQVAYILPEEQRGQLIMQPQKGSHRDIYTYASAKELQEEVFTLKLPHGTTPKDASYSYIVVPAISHRKAQKYAQEVPIQIVRNDEEIQAVAELKTGLLQAVFHQQSDLLLSTDTQVHVDKPCVLILHKNGALHVADPTQKLTDLTITLIDPDGRKQVYPVTLPQGSYAGKTVHVNS